jgi:hypothetical protein
MVTRLRLAGTLLLVSGGLLCVVRHRARRWLEDLVQALATGAADLAAEMRAAAGAGDRAHWLVLGLVVAGGAALRLAFLFQPMRYDEAYTFLQHAARPLYIGLSNYAEPNNHLFHTLLVHVTAALLGPHPWAIRLPACLAGLLAVPAAYLLARSVYTKEAALVAAAAVASSSALVEYSTQARGYTLVALVFLLILALAAYLVSRRNAFAWLLFVVLSALGFYTVPVMLYPFGVAVAWMALTAAVGPRAAGRQLLADLAMAVLLVVAVTAVLYAPVFIATGITAVVANPTVVPQPLGYLGEHLPASLGEVWRQWNRDLPRPVSAALLVGFAVSLLFARRLTPLRVPLPAAVLAWCGPLLLVQRVVPFPRVWLFLLPLYLTLAAGGIGGLLAAATGRWPRHRALVFGTVALATCAGLGGSVLGTRSILVTTETGALPDAEGLALFLKERLGPDERVLAFVPSDAPLRYYFRRHGLSARLVGSLHPRHGLGSDLRELRSSPRLWVVVNRAHGQTVELLDQWRALLGEGLGPPRAVREYPSATRYEVERRP